MQAAVRSAARPAGCAHQLTHRRSRSHSLLSPRAAAGSGSDSPSDWAARAVKAKAEELKAKAEEFARQQRLQERMSSGLKAAQKAAAEAAAAASSKAASAAKQADAEYDLSSKAESAARAAAEAAAKINDAAADADSKWGVRRRLRVWFADARRALPTLGRNINEFLNTPLGAMTFFFLFLVSGERGKAGAGGFVVPGLATSCRCRKRRTARASCCPAAFPSSPLACVLACPPDAHTPWPPHPPRQPA